MQHYDALFGLQFGQRLLQANRMAARLLDKWFNERFAPGIEHSATKTAAESRNASETNSGDFDGFTIEHVHACLIENFADRKSTRLNSSHIPLSRMPSSA